MTNNTGYGFGGKPFLGQVPPESNQHYGVDFKDQHGDRVKVRIPGMHPMESSDDAYELCNEDLPWAIVARPTTHGNRNYQSSGIWGGEWVIGFFMDEDCQIPVITQVLSNHEKGEIRKSDCTTLGKPVKRYTRGNPASRAQTNSPSVTRSMMTKFDLDKNFFDSAKK
jgi:hypothetical protein